MNLQVKRIPVDRIAALLADSATVEAEPHDLGFINPCHVGGREVLYALGEVHEHTDMEFPRWAYILVLRADRMPVLHVRGCEPLELETGMLVEFDAHAPHSLEQPDDSLFVWAPLDYKEKQALAVAEAEHFRLWDKAAQSHDQAA